MFTTLLFAFTHWQVSISAVPGKKTVVVEGAKASVLGTKADIISQFARIQADEKRKAKELLLSHEVGMCIIGLCTCTFRNMYHLNVAYIINANNVAYKKWKPNEQKGSR